MLAYLYEWIRNIAYYMVLITVSGQILPRQGCKKYIQFFTRLVLILLIMTPIFEIFGMKDTITDYFEANDYETYVTEMEEASTYFETQKQSVEAEVNQAAEEKQTAGGDQGAGAGMEEADMEGETENSIKIGVVQIGIE